MATHPCNDLLGKNRAMGIDYKHTSFSLSEQVNLSLYRGVFGKKRQDGDPSTQS